VPFRFNIDRGSVCKIANDRGVSEEIRGRKARVIAIRADGLVNVAIRTGPAKGATQLLHPDELASCRRGPKGMAGARRRRRRR
jgi:hypothetical protein